MKRIFICTFLIFSLTVAKSQSDQAGCNIAISTGQQWKGVLKQGTATKQLSTASFSIEPTAAGQYKVSDLSAGFFSQFNINKKLEAVLSFNCFDITPVTFTTEYGPCKIVDGHWDATAKQLTIHWTIEFNQVDETSIFTVQ